MKHKRKAGIVGIPPLAVIAALNREGAKIHDLDTPITGADLERSVPYLPRVYCAILRTVVLNALALELDAIYIDVGPGKCDGALYVAAILEELLAIPVIRTRNEDRQPFGTPICRTEMALMEKFERITAGVTSSTAPAASFAYCPPTTGFWGVPPRDFSILALFPATTHIYGWTRCMENKTPADPVLEAHFNPAVPTVFFAQTFCAKSALAMLLASQHPTSLYLDCDVTAGSSARAKIGAFLELHGVPA